MRKKSLALLLGLVLVWVLQLALIQPGLKRLHLASHAANRSAAERQGAASSFARWNAVSHVIHFLVIASLGGYIWRLANHSEPTRFISPGKYRG